MDWQPIETAPADLREALLCFPAYTISDDDTVSTTRAPDIAPLVTRGHRLTASHSWEADAPELSANGEWFGDDWEFGAPTHWMPLPAPPA